MARSVRHWSASPSGSLTGSFCKDTSSDRMVSSRGLRDRRHRGHRNFRSLAACTAEAWELLFFMFADFGRGTHVPKIETNFITYCWQNEICILMKTLSVSRNINSQNVCLLLNITFNDKSPILKWREHLTDSLSEEVTEYLSHLIQAEWSSVKYLLFMRTWYFNQFTRLGRHENKFWKIGITYRETSPYTAHTAAWIPCPSLRHTQYFASDSGWFIFSIFLSRNSLILTTSCCSAYLNAATWKEINFTLE